MSRKRRTGELRRIVEVRDAQQRGAEMRLAAAAQDVERRRAAREEQVEALTLAEADWTRRIQAGVLDPLVCGGWAAAVLEAQAAERTAGHRLDEAQQTASERRDAWRNAEARRSAAGDLVRQASKALARRREETALADQEDRAAARKAAS